MNHSDELRKIAKDIVKTEAGGLKKSQYWGLRLRLIAMKLDGPLTSPFSGQHKQELIHICSECGLEHHSHMAAARCCR